MADHHSDRVDECLAPRREDKLSSDCFDYLFRPVKVWIFHLYSTYIGKSCKIKSKVLRGHHLISQIIRV